MELGLELDTGAGGGGVQNVTKLTGEGKVTSYLLMGGGTEAMPRGVRRTLQPSITAAEAQGERAAHTSHRRSITRSATPTPTGLLVLVVVVVVVLVVEGWVSGWDK